MYTVQYARKGPAYGGVSGPGGAGVGAAAGGILGFIGGSQGQNAQNKAYRDEYAQRSAALNQRAISAGQDTSTITGASLISSASRAACGWLPSLGGILVRS